MFVVPPPREAARPPVGRLAPSPTGWLHLGHARSFLLAWWDVRSRGGRIVLRLEDLDRSRVRPEFEDGVLRDLEWLGVDWDGPVLRQSERSEELLAAARGLLESGRAYPCVCTRAEIRAAVAAPHAGEGEVAYPGTCRGRWRTLEEAERASGRRAALRFRTPAGAVELTDRVAGRFRCEPAAEVGDFPITTREGAVAYQLAVVLDDAAQGVTDVLRGDDLLPSAGRQALLQRALGLAHPAWAHVPLVLDASGRRLAKRAAGLSLRELREGGVRPEEIVAWAARSAGQPAAGPRTAAEVLAAFDLARLPPDPVRLPDGDPLAAPGA